MKKRLQVFSVFFLFLIFGSALQTFGQNVQIKGKVTDASTGQTLPGVSIVVKSTTIGTITNLKGFYSISVKPGSSLVFSYVGYQTQTIAVGKNKTINVFLHPATTGLNEVVVVGYGTQRKESITGSVASVKGSVIREVPSSNITRSLQGRLAGVSFQQSNSKPGSDMQIRIRGARSLTASNSPLIVLNGIPYAGQLSDISPDAIKSINILKDASATAIYGSRGANGVILITTKTGYEGEKVHISLNSYEGLENVFSDYPMMNGPQFVALRKAAGMYTNGVDESNNTNINWQKLLYRTAMVTNNDLGITGGTKHGDYSFGMGYYNQQAVLPGQNFKRYTLRGKIDQQIGVLRIGLTMNQSYSVSNGNNLGIYSNLSSTPIANPYNSDGTLKRVIKMPLDENWVETRKSVNALGDAWIDQSKTFGSFNSLYAIVKCPWVKGLQYRVNVGLNYRQNIHGEYTGEGVFSSSPTNPSTASLSNSHTINWTVENLLSYHRHFAKNQDIHVLAMYSAEQNSYNSSYISARGIPSNAFQFYNLGQASSYTINPNYQGYAVSGLESWMGRIIYSYANRYMLTAAFRADASSVLAPGHQWHSYPAVSVGWNIMNESFMKKYTWINELKLRAGYGETSNQAISPYQTLGRLSTVPYNFGPTGYATGLYVSQLPNPKLGWEFTKEWDYGLDFALFNNRLTGTVEYYKENTSNVLLGLTLPPTSGVTRITANIGSTQNKGFELTLNGEILKNHNGWSWDFGFNVYSNRNKITSLASGQTEDVANKWFVGYPINCIYDYQRLGLWNTNSPGYQYFSILEPGGNLGMIRVKYTGTYNADGSPTRAIGPADMHPINPEPKFMGGFNTRVAYKNFDLSAVGIFQDGGILISSLYGPTGYLNLESGRRNNVQIDYWTPTNTNARFPKPGGIQSGDNPKYLSTESYFNASYLKIRNITLGYNFNKKWIKKAGITKIRLYVTIQNPFVFFSPYKKMSGMDPTTNSTGNQNQAVNHSSNYSSKMLIVGTNTPETRNYLLGLSLTF